MKRSISIAVAAIASIALFALLVHAVLVIGDVSDSAGTPVRGTTARRLWASAIAIVGLIGTGVGALSLARPTHRLGRATGRSGAVVALTAGGLALVNGILNVGTADGGPGSGNGVVGAAAACVLGAISTALGLTALQLRRQHAGRTTST